MEKIFGYCRVSTKAQSIERQVRNIQTEYPAAEIIQEKYSGKTQDRPAWKKLLDMVRAGDTIIFDSVSRMARNADEGWKEYKALYDMGVELVFLQEHTVDTRTFKEALNRQLGLGDVQDSGDSACQKLLEDILTALNSYIATLAEQQVRLAFEQAQKELDDLHQRTREGLETARRNGKQLGRPAGSSMPTKKKQRVKQRILKESKDFGGSKSDLELIASTKVSKSTYYRYKRELLEENPLRLQLTLNEV